MRLALIFLSKVKAYEESLTGLQLGFLYLKMVFISDSGQDQFYILPWWRLICFSIVNNDVKLLNCIYKSTDIETVIWTGAEAQQWLRLIQVD